MRLTGFFMPSHCLKRFFSDASWIELISVPQSKTSAQGRGLIKSKSQHVSMLWLNIPKKRTCVNQDPTLLGIETFLVYNIYTFLCLESLEQKSDGHFFLISGFTTIYCESGSMWVSYNAMYTRSEWNH